MTTAAPETTRRTERDPGRERDTPWVVILWNDPINLASYVTYVLQKVLGIAKAEAERLMVQAHEEGKAVVSTGTREKSEQDVALLHGYGLWATLARG